MFKRVVNKNLNVRYVSYTVYLNNKNVCPAGGVQHKKHEQMPQDWDTAMAFENIPGPKPLPIIGNMWRFLIGDMKVNHDNVLLHTRLNKQYGDVCAVRKIGGIGDFIFIYNPDEIAKMYRNEGIWPVREGFFSLSYYRNVMRKSIFGETDSLMYRNEGSWPIREGFYSIAHYRNVMRKDVFGETGSLLTTHGEEWYEFRSKVNPILMQPRTAEQYITSMNSVADDFINRVKELQAKNPQGEMPTDFDNEINKWSFESIGVIALDRRLGCLDQNPNADSQRMIHYMVEMFKMMLILDYSPVSTLYRKYNAPLWRKFVKYQDFFTNMALKFINEAEEKIKADPNYASKSQIEKSAFEQLLQKDKRVAVVMTLDMLSAGIDTTGKITSAILYLLSKNPEVQSKLRKEILTLLPNKTDPITKDVLANAKYLKAVIKEAARIAPIGIGNLRLSSKSMVLSGYQIPAGVNIVVPNLYLSSIDRHYLKPKEFIPERWIRTTEGELSNKNVHPFVSLPFGFGPRSCIGKRLANLEIETLTTKMVRNFILEWPHKDMKFGQELLYGIQDPLKLHLKTYPH